MLIRLSKLGGAAKAARWVPWAYSEGENPELWITQGR